MFVIYVKHPKWFFFYDLLHFTGQDFTAVQRERAQEDFKVLFKGAPPHPPSHSHTKDSHSTGITLLFSNSAWVLLRPTELSTFKELWDGTSDLSSLSEKTRKSNHLQMKLQRQHFLLSYLKTLSVGPVELTTSRVTARCTTKWATGARCTQTDSIRSKVRIHIEYF